MGVFGSLSRDLWSTSFPRLCCHTGKVTSPGSFLFLSRPWHAAPFHLHPAFLPGAPSATPSHVESALAGGFEEAEMSSPEGPSCCSCHPQKTISHLKGIPKRQL